MLKNHRLIILAIGILIVISACNGPQKVLKSGNNELKYETGMDLYEKGDYNKALQFFDLLRAVFRGTDKGEKLTYYTADCYYQMRDYQIASYYYGQYVQLYPRGEFAEESAYLTAYCKYLESPRASLDQTSTFLALRELQSFIDMYPSSPKVAEANRLMDDLRYKLEIKNYRIAVLYFRMGDYQAAITSFENLMEDYPDTEFKEEVLFSITEAYFSYAEKSVFTKKQERYEKTVEAFNNLRYLYPESVYLPVAQQYNEKALYNLKKM